MNSMMAVIPIKDKKRSLCIRRMKKRGPMQIMVSREVNQMLRYQCWLYYLGNSFSMMFCTISPKMVSSATQMPRLLKSTAKCA